MHIHHHNAGTLCPACKRLINGTGSYLERAEMICHTLIIETPRDGLVLVDTGFGTGDIAKLKQLNPAFISAANPKLDLSETLLSHVRTMGFDPQDVRHILLTHLDLDHAGGINDFPHATVHLHSREYQAGVTRTIRTNPMRYMPHQWSDDTHWQFYSRSGEVEGDTWFGFDGVRALNGSNQKENPDILAIPLFGHTPGHCGIAIKRSEAQGGGWLLHAGDAYFHHWQMQSPKIKAPLGTALFQRAVDTNTKLRRKNQERLRELAFKQAGHVTVINSHDPHYLTT